MPWKCSLQIVEFARDVLGYEDAHSVELKPDTTHPVIHLMPDQEGIDDIGGTLRLGSYPCVLAKDSKAYELYGEETINERHRHRYEVNNDYRKVLVENGAGVSVKDGEDAVSIIREADILASPSLGPSLIRYKLR